MGGRLLVKADSLKSRLAGFSAFGFGVSFKPLESERAVLRELFIFLEDRRALQAGLAIENPDGLVESVHTIRKEFTKTLSRLREGTPATSMCLAMRGACRDFLSAVENAVPAKSDDLIDPKWENFLLNLGTLRSACGLYVAGIAHLYKLPVEGDLVLILPPAVRGTGPSKKNASPKRR